MIHLQELLDLVLFNQGQAKFPLPDPHFSLSFMLAYKNPDFQY
jgi:hypothetical protein